ncbi:MAG TPA: hypothetical protein VEA99_17930 [Gemmatimonadaceae bacterium]|nr:hypothetical protein [Gemmatimonadaceae bacterium]
MRASVVVAFAAALALPAAVAAQSTHAHPAPVPEHEVASGWKELDAFHKLIGGTWHPVERAQDLGPIREKAPALAEAAEKWGASKVPAACDRKEIRDAIAAAVTGSKDVARLVAAKATDVEITKALRDVHDRFEVVEGGCHPTEKK